MFRSGVFDQARQHHLSAVHPQCPLVGTDLTGSLAKRSSYLSLVQMPTPPSAHVCVRRVWTTLDHVTFFLRLCHIETCLCACLKINTSASRAQGRAAAFFPPSSSGLCLRRSPASFMYLHSHNGGSEISACASAIRNLHAFLTYMDISLQVQGGSVPLPSSTCILRLFNWSGSDCNSWVLVRWENLN